MALPLSGPISLTDIQAEFGGSNPVSLSEYYKGGAYVTITDFAPNVPTSGEISLGDFYGAAKTQLYTYTYTSNTVITLPSTFQGILTVSALGGGGGSGGDDAGRQGYAGYAGLIANGTISANPGDVVIISVGGGGVLGASNAPLANPGAGGSSSVGYNGGRGGRAGGSGASGAGGGGGAATVVQVGGTIKVVAAGGGGGGGSGLNSWGMGNQNNPGTNGTIYGGQGQDKGGDGGGAGGGGAGQNGGAGGVCPGGDVGAYSGENGVCLIPAGGSVSTGSNGGPHGSSGGAGSVTISYYAV